MSIAAFVPHALALSTGTKVALWIIGALLVSGFLFGVVAVVVASFCVYDLTLRRKTKEQWGRNPSCDDAAHLKMDAEGMEWHYASIEYKQDVHIVNDGLNLYGEYYDFGSDKCVMILSGRTESLRYGYYFAIPYAKAGFNVLVVDPRAHGLSDGEFNTVGFEESRDVIAWTRFLEETYHLSTVILHGICIGAAGGMYAITSPECPKCVSGIVTDGMFPNFGESMKNHLIERKKPVFPIYQMINFWMKHYTGHSMNYGPFDVIEKLDKPILMFNSLEDLYSLPVYTQKMYDLVKIHQKKLVWFDHGAHSMLRVTDTQKYDAEITAFLAEHFTTAAAK